jgi:hypothetical protein
VYDHPNHFAPSRQGPAQGSAASGSSRLSSLRSFVPFYHNKRRFCPPERHEAKAAKAGRWGKLRAEI